ASRAIRVATRAGRVNRDRRGSRGVAGVEIWPRVGSMPKFYRAGLLVVPIVLMPPLGQVNAAKPPAPPTHPPKTETAVKRLGGVAGWSAYTYKERSGQVCYVLGFPAKREPPSGKRKAAVMMVTHRPQEHVTDVVSLAEGYVFKEGSDASLDVDGKKFDLF